MSSVHSIKIKSIAAVHSHPMVDGRFARPTCAGTIGFASGEGLMPGDDLKAWAIPEQASEIAFLEAERDRAYPALDDLLSQTSTILLDGTEEQLAAHDEAVAAQRMHIDLLTGALERLRDPEAQTEEGERLALATLHVLMGLTEAVPVS